MSRLHFVKVLLDGKQISLYDAFEKVIIEDCSSLEQMNERERYWIAALSATNPEIGYNRWPKFKDNMKCKKL